MVSRKALTFVSINPGHRVTSSDDTMDDRGATEDPQGQPAGSSPTRPARIGPLLTTRVCCSQSWCLVTASTKTQEYSHMNQTVHVLRAESAAEIPEMWKLQCYRELAAGWRGWASYERQAWPEQEAVAGEMRKNVGSGGRHSITGTVPDTDQRCGPQQFTECDRFGLLSRLMGSQTLLPGFILK